MSIGRARRCGPHRHLRSPSQQVRDKAAQILKVSFVPTPRSQWEPVVATLKPGDSRHAVLQALSPYGVTHQGTVGGGGTSTESYRLDDVWVLGCSYGRSNELFRTNLHQQLRHVWVAPASDFSGVWTTYFVNGRRSQEIHYRNGSHFGAFTTFRPDGSRLSLQYYGPEGAQGRGHRILPFRSAAVPRSASQQRAGRDLGLVEQGTVPVAPLGSTRIPAQPAASRSDSARIGGLGVIPAGGNLDLNKLPGTA